MSFLLDTNMMRKMIAAVKKIVVWRRLTIVEEDTREDRCLEAGIEMGRKGKGEAAKMLSNECGPTRAVKEDSCV